MHPIIAETLDTHTAGEPTRIVVDGVDHTVLGDGSVADKRDRFAATQDELRRLLLCEPRGHDDMFGAVPVDPDDDRADLGLFFMDSGGYLDQCGHGTIGAITALIETSQLTPADEIVVETPAGLVHTRPDVRNGRVESVAMENVPSYVYDAVTVTIDPDGTARQTSVDPDDARRSIPVDFDGTARRIPIDLVVAGNVFALADASDLDLSIDPTTLDRLVDVGLKIRERINATHEIVDPFTGESRRVDLVEFYESPAHGIAEGGQRPADRNVVVFGEGQIDRSPCGTGTCAKLTLLHHRGALDVGDPYRYESVIGTRFTGRLLDVEMRDGIAVTTPEVTGSAHLTGRHTFLRDDADKLEGFSLRKSG